MNLRRVMTTLIAVLLCACASYEGTYSPDCIAYEGSNVSLSDGKFVWEKFTDSVVVDDAGKVVNQFPAYPIRGSYRIEGHTLYLEAASGASLANMYLRQHNERQYLLTAEQFEAWEKTGHEVACALVLGGHIDKDEK